VKLLPLDLAGLLLIEPRLFGDERGFFMESWNRRSFAAAGLDVDFVQDNHSRSAAGVLRGLHYQLQRPQGKLVRVTAGRAYDVAVDLRRSSPTYGRWHGVELSAANRLMFWVPPGFAHGFLSLEDGTEFQYKCTDFYDPADEHSLLWNDPALAIDWPLDAIGTPVLSAKDEAGKPLADAASFA
jgi:dTDP-4-dehydrorhamnose 3,5-epimerase